MRFETTHELDDLTDLKIRIPMRHHVRLHAARYVTGKPISEMVADALEAYLPPILDDETSSFHRRPR